jgi:uncharacterized membrane protein YtjA (UPF0391 family)
MHFTSTKEGDGMLHAALVLLVVGLVAAFFGFTTIAGTAFGLAKILAVLFLVAAAVLFLLGRSGVRSLRNV